MSSYIYIYHTYIYIYIINVAKDNDNTTMLSCEDFEDAQQPLSYESQVVRLFSPATHGR